MLDHVTISVSDYAKSRDFYRQALAPLGYEIVTELEHATGFGARGKPQFWIRAGGATSPGVHVAFACRDHEHVKRFHAAALAAGGRDHGAPGIRPEYHASYFGAFVLDPDGNNVEAVCHDPAVEGSF